MPYDSGFVGGGGGEDLDFGGHINDGTDSGSNGKGSVVLTATILYVVCVVLVLSLSLGLGTEPHTIASSEIYALNDNRLISYRGDFCVNLRATSTQEPKNDLVSATLAFLRSRPPLTGRQRLNLRRSATLNSVKNFNSWNFNFNYNSNISIDVCYQSFSSLDNSVAFFLIKGRKNYKAWLETEDAPRAIQSIRLQKRCTSISYRVIGDAVYYFVFYLSDSDQRSTGLNINFYFNRTLYEVSSDMVVKNCSFPLDGRSGCTLDAPMTPGYTGFLSFNAKPPVDYNDGAEISIGCSPRGWLYAVIVIVVALVAACLFGVFVVVCYILKKKDTNRSVIEMVKLRITSNLTTELIPSRHERSTVSSDPVPVEDQAPTITADSVLLKDEPPSYSYATKYGMYN